MDYGKTPIVELISDMIFTKTQSKFYPPSTLIISKGFVQVAFTRLPPLFLLDHSLKKLNSLWSKTQSKLPTNIFNFTIKYLNNTLATRKNLYLWNLFATSDCSSCSQPEPLLHVVAGSETCLDQEVLHGDTTQHLPFLLKLFML